MQSLLGAAPIAAEALSCPRAQLKKKIIINNKDYAEVFQMIQKSFTKQEMMKVF